MITDWTIDFTLELPKGIKTRDGVLEAFTRVENKNARKKFAVVKIHNGELVNLNPSFNTEDVAIDTKDAYEVLSLHDTLKLAEGRAGKETRACEDIDTEYIAVPLKIRNRGVCYFINSGNSFGSYSGENLAIVDTTAWGLHEWTRISQVWRKADLARHFEKGDHKFDGKQSVYDYTLRKWTSITACSVNSCYLPKP